MLLIYLGLKMKTSRTINVDGIAYAVPIEYTSDIEPSWAWGVQSNGKIKIKPIYKDRKSILMHELKHAEQFYRHGGINGNFNELYANDAEMRYAFEIEAYGETIKANGYRNRRAVEWIAETLVNNYNIPKGKTKEMVLDDLERFLVKESKIKKPKNYGFVYGFGFMFLLFGLVWWHYG